MPLPLAPILLLPLPLQFPPLLLLVCLVKGCSS